jgi:glycosyltransferase involved in cell wall biosynthesis
MAYDSLVQRARNDLVRLAIEGDFDDLIFVDSDVEWDPEWIFKLLDYKEDVVGGIYPKKTDNIAFPIKAINDKLEIGENGLMEVEGLPTGFMRISKSALKKVWDDSLEYRNEGRIGRMVFDIKVVNGELVSEDIIFCQKWRDLGGKIWLDPSMTCNHIGIKKYTGNFLEFLKNLQGATS